MTNEPTQNDQKIRVRMAEVDSICVYQVTEFELEILEKGSPNSLYLNFAIASITTALSFLIALVSTEIKSSRVFDVFVIVSILGFALGLFMIILWYRAYKSSSSIAKKIKNRLKEDIAPKTELNDSVKPVI